MFQQLEDARPKTSPRYALLSFIIHGAIILGVMIFAFVHARPDREKKAVEVSFKGPGKGPGAPPPPPPPGGKSRPRARKVFHKIEIPKQIETPKPVALDVPKEKPKEEKPEAEDEGEPAGVQGGVVGGVVGGIVGGTVGSTGGGGTAPPPPPPAEAKPKNVPAFVMKRDEINRPEPRMTEVYKATHLGSTLRGAYNVCVGTDGHVYDVQIVTSIPGADSAMIEGIMSEWLYKERKERVCFLYPASVTIQ